MPRGKEQQAGMDFEESFAKKLGAKLQVGSGNKWFAKLDVSDGSILWSLKHTGKQSLSVTKAILSEAIREATNLGSPGLMPGVAVDIAGEDFVILRADDFVALVEQDIKIAVPSKASVKRARARVPQILRDDTDE